MYSNDPETYIREKGEMMIAPLGSSMRPLLKGDDCQVILKYPREPLCRYDVVLYRGAGNRLILHRIIQCGPQGYLIRGDNTYLDETGITDAQILGVMTGFYRKDKYISCDTAGYRIYTRVWIWLYPVRKLLISIWRRLRRKKK